MSVQIDSVTAAIDNPNETSQSVPTNPAPPQKSEVTQRREQKRVMRSLYLRQKRLSAD